MCLRKAFQRETPLEKVKHLIAQWTLYQNIFFFRHEDNCNGKRVDWKICSKCGAMLKTEKTLKAHIKKCNTKSKIVKTQGVKVACGVSGCHYEGDAKVIARHRRKHLRQAKRKEKKRVTCDCCHNTFCDKSSLNRHVLKNCRPKVKRHETNKKVRSKSLNEEEIRLILSDDVKTVGGDSLSDAENRENNNEVDHVGVDPHVQEELPIEEDLPVLEIPTPGDFPEYSSDSPLKERQKKGLSWEKKTEVDHVGVEPPVQKEPPIEEDLPEYSADSLLKERQKKRLSWENKTGVDHVGVEPPVQEELPTEEDLPEYSADSPFKKRKKKRLSWDNSIEIVPLEVEIKSEILELSTESQERILQMFDILEDIILSLSGGENQYVDWNEVKEHYIERTGIDVFDKKTLKGVISIYRDCYKFAIAEKDVVFIKFNENKETPDSQLIRKRRVKMEENILKLSKQTTMELDYFPF